MPLVFPSQRAPPTAIAALNDAAGPITPAQVSIAVVDWTVIDTLTTKHSLLMIFR